MLSRTFQKLLFGVAFFLCFSSFADQYPPEAKSNKTTVIVHIVWLPNFEAVHAICSFYLHHLQGIVGCYNPLTSTIYAVEPTSFNDHLRLEILGHEFWHALGAQHP